MKQKMVHLVRHAKSDWNYPGLRDHDRPLNTRGKRNAPEMATRFLSRFEPVEIVLCSDSMRTRETMQYFLDAGCFKSDVVLLKSELYHASAEMIIAELRKVDVAFNKVMIFGHNNGISDLISQWTNSSLHMPTCAIASFELFVDDWQALDSNTLRFIQMDYPKRERA